MNDRTRQALRNQRDKLDIPAPTRSIDFQVDTLSQATGSAAYFSSWVRTVTVNYVEGEDNSFNESKATKAHEQKHRDNYDAGMKNMPMSLEQYYKVCCHDEISANMAELLQLREEYKNAKTQQARDAVINSPDGQRFLYYFDAVKEGKINPFASNSADFEKEMKFIATETQKMWMNNHSQWYDSEAHTSMTESFFDKHDYKEVKDNPENYEKARKIAYTIGGVDFTQYISDIPCINENVKDADKMIAADKPRDDIDKKFKPMQFGHSQVVTSLEQHAKLSAIEGISDELKVAMNVRWQWAACKTDAERQDLEKKVSESGESFIATRWLYAANRGQITPQFPALDKKEQEFIGQAVSSLTNGICSGDMEFLRTYIDDKGIDTIQKAVQSGEADKNYKKELQRLLTVNGVDYSIYVSDPVMSNPYVKVVDDKLKKGKTVDVATDLKDFDSSKDLIIPEFKPIEGMSMEQQLQVAQQKMFMENVKARNPFMEKQIVKKDKEQLDFSKPIFEQLGNDIPTKEQMAAIQSAQVQQFDEHGNPVSVLSPYIAAPQKEDFSYFYHEQSCEGMAAQIYFSDFQKDLNDNPELKAKWNTAVKQMEKQIADANRGALFLPSANDKAYQNALNDVYTVSGVDLRAEYRADCGASESNGLETFVPKIKNTNEIKKVENSSWTDRAKHKMATAYNETVTWTETKAKEAENWAKDTWNTMTNWFSSVADAPAKAQQKKTEQVRQNGGRRGAQPKPEEYRQKRWENEYYTGDPQYRTWSPDNRVSPVLTAEIYDFTKPFLLQQQEALAKKEAEERAKKDLLETQRQRNTGRFDQRVDDAQQQQSQRSRQQQRTTATTSRKAQQTR